MNTNHFNLIRSCKIFSSLDDATLKKLLEKFDKIMLRKNKILFNQGDLSNNVYLLVSGKIILILKTEKHDEKIVGEIHPSELVGQLSSLSHEPRSVTAKAVADSILLKLSSDSFRELCQSYPAISFEIINNYANRSRHLLQSLRTDESIKKHIVIMPASKKAHLKQFYERLTNQSNMLPNIAIISDYDPVFREEHSTNTSIESFIESVENKNETILYFIESTNTPLAKVCHEKVDMIYIVANGGSKPHINRLVRKFVDDSKTSYKINTDLILLYEDEKNLPQHTSKWLKLINFNLHHHIRLNQHKDLQRIMRFLCGQAIGLVLGGGGLRSWAHMGAIKALEDAGIPIDIIGGTSAGAIVAGHYAINENFQESPKDLEELAEITRKTIAIRNFTWPSISLFNGKSYTIKQKKIFDAIKIENLWLPSFYIACNLSSNTQVIYNRGYLWKAIRSSTAVPAIFPPVVIRGKLLLDGGILNNLPVDVMRKLIGSKGTVIAVELTHFGDDETEYNFPTILPFWKVFLARIGWFYKRYKFPSFTETFLKALLAGSSAKQEENAKTADILIRPDLSKFSLLNVSKTEEKELIDMGYKSAITEIEKSKKKLPT